ncbi:30S ribosomal protein S13 [Candidatus Woesearchaeota archaeon]|nr:MAG: 30S ribosomal protein S13 [Candidatus Woesearchaeota archaeon]
MEEKKPGFKHIVRIVNTDLDGNKPIVHAMRKIKGVSFMLANAVCALAGVDKQKKTGTLLDPEIKKIDEILKNPKKFGAPSWMLNRRRDYETGEDLHILTTDIKFIRDNDIKRMKMIKSYKGFRHAYGLPVRGQRTKSNFRKNKGKGLGVQKKKVKSGKV